ncbi:uncharacterized protein KRP23_11709 [Phytophthora ramorum]|uniref:uncharacterized protein n=1 Tax=Phytophthora ramorum TaxID=164328 RepID=UPI0030948861|nr:hypothetical protein KRP23_11709 [Phytophthora ramorum]
MVSTPTWTVALFQRVLANLPPREVAAASSRVLEEEFSSVHRLVDDVVASFAKLAEVRDAVSKLEQSSASTGRELDRKMKKMAVNTSVKRPGNKRKDRDESEQENKGTKLEPVNKDAASTACPIPASNESSSNSKSGSENEQGGDGSEAAVKALMTLQTHERQSAESKDMADISITGSRKSAITGCSLSVANLKPILIEVDTLPRLDRILVMPEILEALNESVIEDADGRQTQEVIDSLRIVIKWVSEPHGQSKLFALYRAYADTVKKYANTLPASGRRIDLKRLSNDFQALLSDFKAFTTANIMDSRSKGRNNHQAFVNCVKKIRESPVPTHKNHLLKLFVTFKKATVAELMTSPAKQMRKAMNVVARPTKNTRTLSPA